MRFKVWTGLAFGCSALALHTAPAFADATPECNVGPGDYSTECGVDSAANGSSAVAVGHGSSVAGTASSGSAIGTAAAVHLSGGTALGAYSTVNTDGLGGIFLTPMPDEIGGTALGAYSRTQGSNSVAVGGFAVVGRPDFNFILVDDGTAIGAGSRAAEHGSTALGSRATASGLNSVAIGANSAATEADTVSFGTAGNERRLTNIANGISETDGVNVGQLQSVSVRATAALTTANTAIAAASAAQNTADEAMAVGTTAQISANTAQLTANTAVDMAVTAQDTADTAVTLAGAAQTTANAARNSSLILGQNTAQVLGGGTQFDPATGVLSNPTYLIGGASYNNVGSALTALDSRIDNVYNMIDTDRRETRRGVAAAMALAQPPFPSAPGRTSYTANTATYRGEWAMSGSLSHRLNVNMPFAVSAGVSYSGDNNTAARFGIAGEF